MNDKPLTAYLLRDAPTV